MAQYRLDQLARPQIHAALGKGQDASLGYTGPRYKLGDEFQVQFSDVLTHVPGRRQTLRVTAVEGDVVKLNGGNLIMTTLGAFIKNGRGSYDPPFGATPVEFQVGKSFSGRTTLEGGDGRVRELRQNTKIVGRETITVPAGTFQTYVFEATVYISDGPTLKIKYWMDPRYGYPIRREELGHNQKGHVVRSDRQELVAIKADRS